jgi:enoyl-CoA hydratase/carnithine racemase
VELQTNPMSPSLSPLNSVQLLHLTIADGVATVRLDNPPVNVLSGQMMLELHQVLRDLAARPAVKVIVLESANPDFFVAHVDMHIVDEPVILAELGSAAPDGLNIFQAVGERLRAQPQVTIVKLQGIARGGGAELVAAADMSFAARAKGQLAQCEALMGLIPGGGATQYLSARMTRGRALEVILGADLLDAPTAERYGWINRALPDEELDAFVNRLAHNIAALPEGVLATTKKILPPVREASGFTAEHAGWAALAFAPRTAHLMQEALQNGAQTVAGELRLEELLRGLDAVNHLG